MSKAKIKILVVDDDVTSLDLIDLLFEDKGFDVVRRADGTSAVECVLEAKPDIILVDLMMPGITGQEAVRQIRAKGITAPIVAFTALDDTDVHTDAMNAGCNLVLTKPCKPSELVKHIENLVRH
ncbi:MAG: response regulator transcription factor [bacterium]|nr:response regulator transcription factor [bacterium]